MTHPVAALHRVTKTYQRGSRSVPFPVLEDLSFTIAGGESVAITGPSGSGKTTLLNILGTLDRPDSGEVLLDGHPVDHSRAEELTNLRHRYIGFIFQLHHLLPQLTVEENILLPLLPRKDKQFREEARQRACIMMKTVGLSSLADHFPGTLSVGECQRTAVLRALVHRPRLLLADEPTGSLDAQNAATLTGMILELQQQFPFALVLVTHDNTIAVRMQKQLRLINGQLK